MFAYTLQGLDRTSLHLSAYDRERKAVNHFNRRRLGLGTSSDSFIQGIQGIINRLINRADIHPETNAGCKRFAAENRFDLIAEIPYVSCLIRALAEGKLAITAYPDAPSPLAIKGQAEKLTGLCYA